MNTLLSKLGIDKLINQFKKYEENNGDGRYDDKLDEIKSDLQDKLKKIDYTVYITGSVKKPISLSNIDNLEELTYSIINGCTLQDAVIYEIQDYPELYIDMDDIELKITDENNNKIANL